MHKALVIIGTRPELIKVAPIINEFKVRGMRKNLIVVNTGQHVELMTNTFRYLDIKPDHDLNLMVPGQSLNELYGRALIRLQQLLDLLTARNEKPSLILAQGDTATACAGALTAFHNRIPFAHIEAGLRTNDFENPFPEEYYRRIISLHATRYFTPTASASNNLLKEGIAAEKITMTGNTIVDAIAQLKQMSLYKEACNLPVSLLTHPQGGKNTVLITCHRRENFGTNIATILRTVRDLAKRHPDHRFVWVRHPNPSAVKAIDRSGIGRYDNVSIVDPLDYFDMIRLYPAIKILITDSGGIQEEAPSFGIPVIILRSATERNESVEKGIAFLCGADAQKITTAFEYCLSNKVVITHNPYGDGKAAQRITDYLQEVLKIKRVKKQTSACQHEYQAA